MSDSRQKQSSLKTVLEFLCVFALAATGTAVAQPVVNKGGVLNAASYILPDLPNSGVAQGSLFVVFGQKMGPTNLVQVSSFPLPTSLAGTSINVTVQATTVDAIMIYSMANQVAAVLPSKTPIGDGTLTVTYNGLTSLPVGVRVVRGAFGIFTRNQAGTGPAVIQNVNSETDRPINSFTNAARPGQTMILWGTGLGPVSGDEAAGPLPGDLNVTTEALVGGKSAKILYKGRSGCCVGVDQIVLEVPQDVQGCLVPVGLRTNGVFSNIATMSIAATGGACSEYGLPGTDFERAAAGSTLNIGYVGLERSSYWYDESSVSPADTGAANFSKSSWNILLTLLAGFQQMTFGFCTVSSWATTSATAPAAAVLLDAGPTLGVRGPGGTKTLSRLGSSSTYLYAGTLSRSSEPAYLVPGDYTVTGVGGTAVGAFQATLTLPPSFSFNWTNRSGINIVERSRDLTISWSGGDATKQRVGISGASAVAGGGGGAFYCTAPMGAGQFTIPARVFSALPAGAAGSLSVGSNFLAPTIFTAPGIFLGYFTFSQTYVKSVEYR